MKKQAKTLFESIFFLALIFSLFMLVVLSSETVAQSSGSSGEANLTIWDDSETQPPKYTICIGYCGPKIKETISQQNVKFYANFTNSSNFVINSTYGNITIRFNQNGSWTNLENMTFNSTSYLWEFTRNFTHKGTLSSSMNATSLYGNLTLYEPILITNTPPYIVKDTGGFISFDGGSTKGILQCTEDTLCTYNLSANVSEDDLNDVLVFNYTASANTTLTNFTINSSSGILIINYTNNFDMGSNSSISKRIEMNVRDTESQTISAILEVNVTAVNDPPYFLNLGGSRLLNKSHFELILAAADEENDINYTFNVSFLSCVHTAQNPAENCNLFNLTFYNATATNISLTPAANQKGIYEINFTVKDFRNASYSQVVNWTVTWNDVPYFTYVCDNERNTTEDAAFSCYINATDTDEIHNLTFVANYTWFTFNGTLNATTVVNTTLGNFSAFVNFTPTDYQVGNWSINVTLTDTGAQNASIASNSTVFYFLINNINDSVDLVDIQNVTAYTSINKTIQINATDNDLLIPDKRIYNESLTFTSNNGNVTISNIVQVSGINRTNATLTINTASLGEGNHTINITVRDANNYSIDSDLFTINVQINTAPEWNQSTQRTFILTEDTAFYYNLSKNVTDSDGDDIDFTYVINNDDYDSNFSNFALNEETGIISFTPRDADVGYWNVTITATDGKTPSSLEFNFTVNNVPDNPSIIALANPVNATIIGNVTAGYNITVQEDNYTSISLEVQDEDYKIEQTSFYNEDLTTNLTIQGPNATLISFGDEYEIGVQGGNRTQANAIFTPRKSDVGSYNITINVSDASGRSSSVFVNLTVLETSHPPEITEIANQVKSILNETLYLDVNVTDLEDGNDTSNPGNFTFVLRNLTAGGNFLTINSTTGIINFTFNSSHAGLWRYNVSVNDTDGSIDSDLFNVTVYDYPRIILPASGFAFNMVENTTYQLNFTVNHTVQDNLNYTLIIRGNIRNSTLGYGNGSVFLWNFTSNFTDETTCAGAINLTLNVSNSKLSNLTSWNLTINHTNYPLGFSTTIPNQGPASSPISVSLSNYFTDIDASDSCVNQTIGFTHSLVPNSTSGGTITVSITDWINTTTPSVNFSADSTSSANYSIIGFEYNLSNSSQSISNATSNNFSVQLTIQTTETPTTSGGGGGGSSTIIKIVSLKIIVPEPVSAKQKDRLVIPLGIVNDGDVDLKKITLSAAIAKDGLLRKDLVASFDNSFFDILKVGERKNVTMIVDIDTQTTGLFEVTINGTVENPEYSDWAKFFIEIEKEEDILERIIFTEEFIIGNPECAEFLDLIEDAKSLFSQGKLNEASQKTQEALEACKIAISQPPSPRLYQKIGEEFFTYAAIASLVAFAVGFAYYYYKKIRLKMQLAGH